MDEIMHGKINEVDTSTHIRIINGNPAVHLTPDLQQQAGISGIQVEEDKYQDIFTARAKILALQPMVELKARYIQLKILLLKAEASMEVSKKEYQRLELLHQDAANISSRDLQQAKIDWISDKAEYENFINQINSLKESSIQTWGEVLTRKIFEQDQLINSLLGGESSLILVILQAGQTITDQDNKILVKQIGLSNNPIKATYISRAPYTDSELQGPAYYYYTSSILVPGIMIEAEIKDTAKIKSGVYIPESAVIWHADKPWVYVKTEGDYFVRKEIRRHQVSDHEWFIEEGIEAGEYVISSGAQMLLSEEFHWSIPDEDDNP